MLLCLLVLGGLVLVLVPVIPGVRIAGAVLSVGSLAGAVFSYLAIKNKSITLVGGRIRVVTVTGHIRDYSPNQVTRVWCSDPNSRFQSKRYIDIFFDDDYRFVTTYNINGDYSSLVEDLKAAVRPTVIRITTD